MHQEDRVRLLLAEAADDLGPTPDLAPGALRAGKRAVVAGRFRTAGISIAAAVAVLTPAALVAPWPGGSSGPAAQYTQSMPLFPAAWPSDSPLEAPTTAYPVVHVKPTKDEGDRPVLTDDQRQVQYAFKQKAADVLQQLLPAVLGTMKVPDRDVMSLQVGTDSRTYAITLRVDPGGDIPTLDCGTNPSCLNGTMPDGTRVAVSSGSAAPPGSGVNAGTVHQAFFSYKGSNVIFGVFPADDGSLPISAQQLLAVITDQRFAGLLDFAVRYPALMHSGYGNTPGEAVPDPAASHS
ncbi:hypothetical protein [Yinghuangia soli]|uniref:Uncharacterized protein n=1 Tax=Yinghuangia soli TaxID=2908204 RepID=A0AA41Q169_9ACTN|nr:hypothetical protein [Yinghuangia soli]MCF2528177.1 hypothetical protein [Yinghuangia soli]